jgi:hypothetical protein
LACSQQNQCIALNDPIDAQTNATAMAACGCEEDGFG